MELLSNCEPRWYLVGKALSIYFLLENFCVHSQWSGANYDFNVSHSVSNVFWKGHGSIDSVCILFTHFLVDCGLSNRVNRIIFKLHWKWLLFRIIGCDLNKQTNSRKISISKRSGICLYVMPMQS